MRIDLQHTWVHDGEGCAISAERWGDPLPRLHKAQSMLLGDWLTAETVQCTVYAVGRLADYWNCAMHSPVWLLKVGIVQCAILAGKDYWLRDKFV